MKWISVDDKLPEPEASVLVYPYQNVYDEDFVITGYYEPVMSSWFSERGMEIKVTHWMPLPLPPEVN